VSVTVGVLVPVNTITYTTTLDGLTTTQGSVNLNVGEELYVDIELRDFIGANSIYAAEIHLQYPGGLIWHPTHSEDSHYYGNEIFQETTSAATLSEHHDYYSESDSKELIYVVSNYSNGADNVSINGTKKLIRFSLKAVAPYAIEGTIKLNVLLVNKAGTTISSNENATVDIVVNNGGVIPL
jgi:hypothetical protein